MINKVNFELYIRPTDFVEPSGCSKKFYLTNGDSINTIFGLFKFPKSDTTYEYVSEHLASALAHMLNIKCCNIDIGIYQNSIGCFSHWIYPMNVGVEFIEGVTLLESFYPDYNKDKYMLNDGSIYSIEMIMPCLCNNRMREDFFKMLIFDFFIGNSDRHHNNWAIIKYQGNIEFSPLYDNSSSLCAYTSDKQIDLCMNNETSLISLCDTNSKSIIGLENKKRPKHSVMIEYIIKNYANNYTIISELCNQILNITESTLKDMVNEYSGILPQKRIDLIIKYLRYKQIILKEIMGRCDIV
ncbi:MAG: HipA domain-containing protein [Oscillospiraceae bacterium]|nr:HipA domain-containing protein [Oscillospiraceae bacterium]